MPTGSCPTDDPPGFPGWSGCRRFQCCNPRGRPYTVPGREGSWSAKGGVGKSTIAANLALYLSMIPHGRGLYKVCLVDYNIESGD
ncbi:MAG: P-loop NTPase, partial [Clostridiales bacterium]|nr:P-loop NTPase [Clostridiales bacterium]